MADSRINERANQEHGEFSAGWVAPLLIALITIVGLSLRLVDITTLPTGLHGDEAIVGLEGQRVLREGYIDPYSPSALGQPSGPFYLSALLLQIFGDTVLAVRMLAVVLGTLTIPALYLVVRRSLGVPVALLSATFLAVMGWHIFYSRIAFPLPSWPFWIVLTAGVVAYAVERRTLAWWAAAGAMAGAGIYTYNAHPLTLAIIGTFVGIWLIFWRWPITMETIKAGLAFVGATIAAMLPMIWFAYRNPDIYFSRFRGQSVQQRSPEWQETDGLLDRAGFIVSEYAGYWQRLCCEPVRDSTDASGVVETVPLMLLTISVAGMILGALRYRSPLIYLGILIVLLMPLSAVFTEGAVMRRTLVLAPFLAMFSAIGVVEIVRLATESRLPETRWPTVVAVAVMIAIGVTSDLRNYYVTFANSDYQRWVFVESLADASHYMQDLPDNHYVYFYADRWSINYETRQFLAPDVQGENRSDEFGTFSLDVDPEQGRPVFILIGDYLPVLEELEERYPDGEVVSGGESEQPTFIAYVLPEQE